MHSAGTTSLTRGDLAAVLMLFVIYLAPAGVAVVRGCTGAGRLARANLVYGWTGIGWLAVLVVALLRPTARG